MLAVRKLTQLGAEEYRMWHTLYFEAREPERQAREYARGAAQTRAENLDDEQAEVARELFRALHQHANTQLDEWQQVLRAGDVHFEVAPGDDDLLQPGVVVQGTTYDTLDAQQVDELRAHVLEQVELSAAAMRRHLTQVSRMFDVAVTSANPAVRPFDLCQVVRAGPTRWLGCRRERDAASGETRLRWTVVIRRSKGAAQSGMHLQVRTAGEQAALYSLLALAPVFFPHTYARHDRLLMSSNGTALTPELRATYFKRAQVECGMAADEAAARNVAQLRQLSATLAALTSDPARQAAAMGHGLHTTRNFYTDVPGQVVLAAGDEYYQQLGGGIAYAPPAAAVAAYDDVHPLHYDASRLQAIPRPPSSQLAMEGGVPAATTRVRRNLVHSFANVVNAPAPAAASTAPHARLPADSVLSHSTPTHTRSASRQASTTVSASQPTPAAARGRQRQQRSGRGRKRTRMPSPDDSERTPPNEITQEPAPVSEASVDVTRRNHSFTVLPVPSHNEADHEQRHVQRRVSPHWTYSQPAQAAGSPMISRSTRPAQQADGSPVRRSPRRSAWAGHQDYSQHH